jgi:hypothetical protein
MELSYNVQLNIGGIHRFSHVLAAYGAIFPSYRNNDGLCFVHKIALTDESLNSIRRATTDEP